MSEALEQRRAPRGRDAGAGPAARRRRPRGAERGRRRRRVRRRRRRALAADRRPLRPDRHGRARRSAIGATVQVAGAPGAGHAVQPSACRPATCARVRSHGRSRRRTGVIRVLIADDNAVIRRGIASLLTSSADDIEVVGEAGDGREADRAGRAARARRRAARHPHAGDGRRRGRRAPVGPVPKVHDAHLLRRRADGRRGDPRRGRTATSSTGASSPTSSRAPCATSPRASAWSRRRSRR